MSKKKKADNQDSLPWNFQDISSKLDDIALKLAKEITKYEPSDLLHSPSPKGDGRVLSPFLCDGVVEFPS